MNMTSDVSDVSFRMTETNISTFYLN